MVENTQKSAVKIKIRFIVSILLKKLSEICRSHTPLFSYHTDHKEKIQSFFLKKYIFRRIFTAMFSWYYYEAPGLPLGEAGFVHPRSGTDKSCHLFTAFRGVHNDCFFNGYD